MFKPRLIAILIYAFALALCGATRASAQDPVGGLVSDARLVGEGRLTYLFWDVYDARLYAPGGVWRADRPFALTLQYLRDISGRDIADRSVQEMRDQGMSDEVRLAIWHTRMRRIFPDVSPGTRLTGIRGPDGAAHFFRNDTAIGTIDDTGFSRAFFGIWLNAETSVPDLRRKLLGADR